MRFKVKFTAIFIVVICLLLPSCRFINPMQETVEINGKEYKLAFTARLYPTEDMVGSDTDVKINGRSYILYQDGEYDCYVSYDNNAEPNIYFNVDQYDEAVSYYTNSENYTYFCKLGNILEPDNLHIIQNIDSGLFEKLLSFSHDNSYNPFTSFNDDDELIRIPVSDPDNWTDDEIHFYKESKDGAFSTLQGHTYILLDGKLALLYYYDFADSDKPVMLIREIPSDLNNPDLLINQEFGAFYE